MAWQGEREERWLAAVVFTLALLLAGIVSGEGRSQLSETQQAQVVNLEAPGQSLAIR